MNKKIQFIINPASGRFEPILSYINQILRKSKYDWDISITRKQGDGTLMARQADRSGADIVAVYGGDGTILEAAQGLCGRKTPLAVIPGGTANVLAKELLIPTDTQQALLLIAEKKYVTKDIDMGQIGNKKFLNRINFGVAADMLKSTDRKSKRNLGQLAYGVSMIKHLREAEKSQFKLNLDGKRLTVEGISLIVTNSGNIGIQGYSLIPDISVTDGLLDVVLVPDSNIKSVVAIAGNTLMQKEPQQELQRWKAKRITIKADPNISVLNDDEEIQVKRMSIKVLPKALRILVPKSK